ncbi:MAG: GNAT family N-acetyltransferase [Endomicrobiia bacterium]
MLKIREVNSEDSKQVKELINNIMKNEFPASEKAYPTEDIENPAKYYNGKKDVFYVAENDNEIIGTVAIKEDTSDTALLRRLFVKKEFRGRGFGSELINKAIEFCKKHNYKKVIFRGTDIMQAALKACLKNGFVEKDIVSLPHFKMFILEKKI